MMENEEQFLENEAGSDELLSADTLRLPEGANILVRLHAVRAWLERRRAEAVGAVGEAALELQQAMQETQSAPASGRLRRRQEHAGGEVERAQRRLTAAQQRLGAYEEAQTLLEESVTHVTSSERVLVEYYLILEELLNADVEAGERSAAWEAALRDVLQRIERVGTPAEEDA